MIPVERDVAHPWHYRDRVFPNRTYCGRIVYNRDKHFFTVSDLERIAKKINPPELPIKDADDKWAAFFRDAWHLFAGTAWPNIFDMPSTFGEYMAYALSNTAEVLSDPIGTLRRRTVILIFDLADIFGIPVTIEEE